MIRDSMIEGRKVWTDQEIVDRDMAATIGRFKEHRNSVSEQRKVNSERRNSIHAKTGMGTLTLDARLALEAKAKEDEEVRHNKGP